MRSCFLRREDFHLIFGRAGAERIKRSLRAVGGEDEQVARFVESQIYRIERIVAFDGQTLSVRPAIDALFMTIDKIELTAASTAAPEME